MAVKQNLGLSTSQNLIMTPAMQQAIKVLELNHLEIQEYIEQQVLENPLLEISHGESDHPFEDVPDASELQQDDAEEDTATDDSDGANSAESPPVENFEDYDRAAGQVDSNFENNFDIGYGDRLSERRPDGAYDEEQTPWEERTAGRPNLQEFLSRQIEIAFPEPDRRFIAAKLTEQLDSNGWFTGNTAELALNFAVQEAQVVEVLQVMQQFEPSGIFARNLAECLRLQLRDLERLDPKMVVLLDHLPLLAESKLAQLMKLCSCDKELLREMVADIRRLNPRPTIGYDETVIRAITPDIFVHKSSDEEWIVHLNEENLPRLLVDRQFYAKALAGSNKTIEKEYLNQQYQNAQWLRKILNQRATTLLKVATAVVTHQLRFLEYGVSALEPLILQQIADQIEMHPSTVSRATSGKYINTPRGIFELKYLFQSGIKNDDPDVRFSAEAIRHRIRTLISEEDPASPVSDDALSKVLHAEGIRLARRTIAKYREEMGLPSSSKRKRRHRGVL